jgi:hypothetical protein
MSMKNSSDTIENRTRDLTACSTVPQPTASPLTPLVVVVVVVEVVVVVTVLVVLVGAVLRWDGGVRWYSSQ